MKTFILNITNEIRNWSDKLDAKAILQSNSWNAINEDGVKEVYIFESNGQLLISRNGTVSKARWSFKSVNSSIIIDTLDGKSYMLIPACYDKKVLTLQVDGTDQYAIFVSQKFVDELKFKSIEDARLYICDKSEYDRRKQKVKTDEINREKLKAWEKKKQYERFIETKVDEYINSVEFVNKKNKLKKAKMIWRCILALFVSAYLYMLFNIDSPNDIVMPLFVVLVIVFLYVLIENAVNIDRNSIEQEMKEKYPFKK